MFSNITRPEENRFNPHKVLAQVLLPDPDSPTNASDSPGNNSKETSFNALISFVLKRVFVVWNKIFAITDDTGRLVTVKLNSFVVIFC